MRTLNYLLLAVRDPLVSAELYSKLLGREPVEKSRTFVLYVLPTGLKIGLWLADEVKPAPKPAGGIELSFSEESRDAVLATHAAWTRLGLKVVQEPTEMDFGFTFVAEDPDGHRLRPFVLAINPR
ncbi:VOC family protein [Polyangium aurulentum]|uniref:VOC family protein n=1 Tax=Polyangium aurulentum TaxID=2567896 RepID=UPI0010ADDAB7|nr:VOC family protein [Polyangium aurulentum]UQA60520.1 VOC family protein [Polyangium aurulentum]